MYSIHTHLVVVVSVDQISSHVNKRHTNQSEKQYDQTGSEWVEPDISVCQHIAQNDRQTGGS